MKNVELEKMQLNTREEQISAVNTIKEVVTGESSSILNKVSKTDLLKGLKKKEMQIFNSGNICTAIVCERPSKHVLAKAFDYVLTELIIEEYNFESLKIVQEGNSYIFDMGIYKDDKIVVISLANNKLAIIFQQEFIK